MQFNNLTTKNRMRTSAIPYATTLLLALISCNSKGDERVNPDDAAKLRTYREFFRHLPLSAKGKVTDEEGLAIPAATIKYHSCLANGPGKDNRAVTDGAGRFSISAQDGISLLISASKDEYNSLSGKSSVQVYPKQSTARSFAPDPRPLTTDDEVTLVLRKCLPHSGALRWTRAVKADMSKQRTVCFHFPTGTIRPPAEGEADVIEFSVDAPARFTSGELGKFTWSLMVRVPGGGLVNRTDRVLFLAPEDGYVNSIYIVNEKGSSTFSCVEGRDLFVKFSDARYGMVHFTFDLRTLDILVFEATLGQPNLRNLTP